MIDRDDAGSRFSNVWPLLATTSLLGAVSCWVAWVLPAGASTFATVIVATAWFALGGCVACSFRGMRRLGQHRRLWRQYRELESRLRLSHREIESHQSLSRYSEFSDFSHEIRTPLTAILGHADLLLEMEIQEHEARRGLRLIQSHGHYLLELLNGFLDLASGRAYRLPCQAVECSVRHLVEEVTVLLAGMTESSGNRLETFVDDSVPQIVHTQPMRLKQVLINLGGNALRHTADGFVRIRVRRSSSSDSAPRLEFEVADNGCGISQDQIDWVFSRFARREEPEGARSGFGLGLAISKEYVSLLGGKIEACSRVGVGTRLRFTIAITPRILASQEDPGGGEDVSIKGSRHVLAG